MKKSLTFYFFNFILLLGFIIPVTHAGELEIVSISIKYSSRTDGLNIEYEKPTNDYGLDTDLLVQIKVKGKVDPTPTQSKVSLNITADGWSDVATGDHEDWVLDQSVKFKPMTEDFWHFLFTVPHKDCYNDAAFKVTVEHNKQTVSKILNVNLACAE